MIFLQKAIDLCYDNIIFAQKRLNLIIRFSRRGGCVPHPNIWAFVEITQREEYLLAKEDLIIDNVLFKA